MMGLVLIALVIDMYWRRFRIKKGPSLSRSQMLSRREVRAVSEQP
jgi:hypothetical protein